MFFFQLFLFMCISVYGYAHVSISVLRPEEKIGCWGVTGDCVLPSMGAGDWNMDPLQKQHLSVQLLQAQFYKECHLGMGKQRKIRGVGCDSVICLSSGFDPQHLRSETDRPKTHVADPYILA